MTALDRFDVDHERYHQEQERLEALQTSVDARAQEIVEEVQGYRKPPFGKDFSDFRNSLSDKDYMDFCDTYFAILFGIRDVGYDDTRQMDADEYAMKWIEEWAEKEARNELEEV